MFTDRTICVWKIGPGWEGQCCVYLPGCIFAVKNILNVIFRTIKIWMSLKPTIQEVALGDVKVKKFLNNVLQEELEPIRQRRKGILRKIFLRFIEFLRKAKKRRLLRTLADVKRAMKINYFEDKELS